MAIPRIRPFSILFSSFSNRQIRSAKRTIIAHCRTAPDVHAVDLNNENISSIETLNVDNELFILSGELLSNIPAVNYKPSGVRQLHMLCHTIPNNDDFLPFLLDWQYKLNFLDKYFAYCVGLNSMLARFQ